MSSSILPGASRRVSTLSKRFCLTSGTHHGSCQLHLLHPRVCQNKQRLRGLFTRARKKRRYAISSSSSTLLGVTSVAIGAGSIYIIYTSDYAQPPPSTRMQNDVKSQRLARNIGDGNQKEVAADNVNGSRLSPFQECADTGVAWIVDFVMPEWAKLLPDHISKLQKELSMAPGSLADEIWQEAQNPYINPEIEYSASVRVSSELCDEEKEFLRRRKVVTTTALAKYLGIPEEDVHPEDVPTIAVVGSGGGLRALVAGTGSMLAAGEAGLFDCVTYTAGVSGSCWLQALYHSSLGERRLDKIVDHLKARIGVHIAYPPPALASLNQAPTNKFLLSGFVEKMKGDPNADFGLVDIYGLLLAARLLIPKGEIGVNDSDLKISNQKEFIKHGEHPMPIYTAVRHEIPIFEDSSDLERATGLPSEAMKAKAKREAYFQWMEITPYEFFCEEFSAGIPTWAIGRQFNNGKDIPLEENGCRLPELRLPLLLGIFGSAFCATLSHYYKEIQPVVRGLAGFGGLDEMIEGKNEDLSKVHPINPASIPNFVYGMEGRLPKTTPDSIYKSTHLQLMDAGMSNNLPIYPLLRPGREVDILIAFDASADTKTDNWLSVADGYARQRGIKGWPIGTGWPKPTDTTEKTAGQLDEAQASTATEASSKLDAAQHEPEQDLGYCTIWVGTTQERSTKTDDVPSKAVKEDWELMQPDAGTAVIYFPFLSNPKVRGVDPVTNAYMSTWNFIYGPEDIDNVIALARANFEEGQEQTKRCVRAVYDRKKKKREERESAEKEARWRRKVRLGIVGKKGEGDHFHLT
ncbi:hypothetical protein G7Y89_g1504 [Cudoniella acicularis]|uniref:Lysophospholipase n=1 Tax=Cudoniella acicularis TaxID=354080 RepID=A0A8H4RY21_9HELO|nr:hypothetical protein G7Y89_g1504 [Cudoniella acicularis]